MSGLKPPTYNQAMSTHPRHLPRFHALIPCAGTGSRAGTVQPKQYQLVAGQPMVMHTLQALARVPQLASGWVVLSPGDDFAGPKARLARAFHPRELWWRDPRRERVQWPGRHVALRVLRRKIGCWCTTRRVA
jgi:hypothetical protein